MIDHLWTIPCSRAIIDKFSNNISLQNIIEQITVQTEPQPQAALAIQMDILTLWTRAEPDAPARGRMRLSLVLPSGFTYKEVEADILLEEHERYRNRIQLSDWPLFEAGRHSLKVELQIEGEEEWRHVESVPLTLKFKPPEDEPEE